jgi:hypothetical protein
MYLVGPNSMHTKEIQSNPMQKNKKKESMQTMLNNQTSLHTFATKGNTSHHPGVRPDGNQAQACSPADLLHVSSDKL